ncbi:MAG: acetyl-CoA carboxylase biotin carboxyl carrier protein [Ruminococcus sp.]|nr:acetyl-CoA carboxylase biotin carboxyl carrier protein [Ruminococcus sp.]
MSEKIVACNLTLGDIKNLAAYLEESGLEKIKIKNGDSEIVIEAKMCPPPPPIIPPMMPNAMSHASASAAQQELPKASEKPAEQGGNIVKSPIVGTFYAAPSPDKPPFVRVGDKVRKGDVIMIIESMKLMNEIQSDFDGTVDKILVSDGQAVEYDQPIMIIK